MKKNTNSFGFMIEVLSLTITLIGSIMLIVSPFVYIPIFQAVMFIVSGLTLHSIYSLHHNFARMTNLMADFLEKTNSEILGKRKVEEIIITDSTSIEELEEFKKKFPELNNRLDEIQNTLKKQRELEKIDGFVKNIYEVWDFNGKQMTLEEQLQEAIKNEDFEKASKIRDEIKKRDM